MNFQMNNLLKILETEYFLPKDGKIDESSFLIKFVKSLMSPIPVGYLSKWYPYDESNNKNYLENIVNGHEDFRPNVATTILCHYRNKEFLDESDSLTWMQKQIIVEGFAQYGIEINEDMESFADDVGDIVKIMLTATRLKIEPDLSAFKLHKESVSTCYYTDGILYYDGKKIPIENITTEDYSPSRQRTYEKAMLDAFGVESLEKATKIQKKYFAGQREAYNTAECIRQSLKDVTEHGRPCFEIIEEDVSDGINDIYWSEYETSEGRMKKVISDVKKMSLDKSPISGSGVGLISQKEKQGICHMAIEDYYEGTWNAEE